MPGRKEVVPIIGGDGSIIIQLVISVLRPNLATVRLCEYKVINDRWSWIYNYTADYSLPELDPILPKVLTDRIRSLFFGID